MEKESEGIYEHLFLGNSYTVLAKTWERRIRELKKQKTKNMIKRLFRIYILIFSIHFVGIGQDSKDSILITVGNISWSTCRSGEPKIMVCFKEDSTIEIHGDTIAAVKMLWQQIDKTWDEVNTWQRLYFLAETYINSLRYVGTPKEKLFVK